MLNRVPILPQKQKRIQDFLIKRLSKTREPFLLVEAGAGIEPTSKDLQSSA